MEPKGLDFNMSGMGSSDGGAFKKVDISGIYTFHTDISAEIFICSGIAKCKESLQTKTFESSGVTKVGMNLKAHVMEVSGTCKIGGNLEVSQMKTSGIVRVGQNLKAHEIDMTGMLKVEENIETEKLSISGDLKNKGFINAEQVVIQAEGNVLFNEIGAAKVKIKDERSGTFWSSVLFGVYRLATLNFNGNHAAVGKLIEGDEIEIEYSKIDILRGKHIKIGPHCLINEIEYSETLEIDPTSKVVTYKKTNIE
ncbi:MAG TPA: hypothetical protein DCY20_01025 [Firmicutes bacterium]|nr:hypothetical protein [Bacillota bacterium]